MVRKFIRRGRKHMLFQPETIDDKDAEYDSDNETLRHEPRRGATEQRNIRQEAMDYVWRKNGSPPDQKTGEEEDAKKKEAAERKKERREVITPRQCDYRKDQSELVKADTVIGMSEYDDFVAEFVDTYLKCDGVMLIVFIQRNAGEIVAAQIVAKLFKYYLYNDVARSGDTRLADMLVKEMSARFDNVDGGAQSFTKRGEKQRETDVRAMKQQMAFTRGYEEEQSDAFTLEGRRSRPPPKAQPKWPTMTIGRLFGNKVTSRDTLRKYHIS